MAREIHDTLAQAFTGISLQLGIAEDTLLTHPESAKERLKTAKTLAREGIKEARRSVRALRSQALESGGLIAALRKLLDKMMSGTNIDSEVIVEGELFSLTPEIEMELFRIAQEAVTNILRYAQASQMSIQLVYETDTVYLQVKDNGVGFDLNSVANKGFGLLGMQERCDRLDGNLAIDSSIEKGTEITVAVQTS